MLFQNGSIDFPNLVLTLSFYLQFAEDNKESCRLNEDGWKYLVVEKADKHGIEIHGEPGKGTIVEAIRAK